MLSVDRLLKFLRKIALDTEQTVLTREEALTLIQQVAVSFKAHNSGDKT